MPRQSKVFPTLTLLSLIGLTTSHLPSRADETATTSPPTAASTTVPSDGTLKTDTDTDPQLDPAGDKKINPLRYSVVDLGNNYDVIPAIGLGGHFGGNYAGTGNGGDGHRYRADEGNYSDGRYGGDGIPDYGWVGHGWAGTYMDGTVNLVNAFGWRPLTLPWRNYYEGIMDPIHPDQLMNAHHYMGIDESNQPLANGWYYGAPAADSMFSPYRDKMDLALNNNDQVVATYTPEFLMGHPTYNTVLLQGDQSVPLNGLVNAKYDERDKDGVSSLVRDGITPDSLEARLDTEPHWIINDQVYGPQRIKIAMVRAYGINDNAHIVGVAAYPGGTMACEYVGGKLHLLPTVAHANTAAMAINNAGQILVIAADRRVTWNDERLSQADYVAKIHFQTLIYNGGGVLNLGTCDGHEVRGLAMNNSRQVAGASYTRTVVGTWSNNIIKGVNEIPKLYHAALYTNGKWKDLGTLGGETSCATAINDSGDVTGWAQTKEGMFQAFLYFNGKMKALGKPAKMPMIGNAINNHGDIVGWKFDNGFLYSRGKMWNLSDLIDTKSDIKTWYPYRINDNGIILASAICSHPSLAQMFHLYALVPIKDKDDKSENSDTNDDNNTTPITDKPQPAPDEASQQTPTPSKSE